MAAFKDILQRHRVSALVGLCVAILIGLLPLSDFLERLELSTHDLRFELRGPRPPRAKIVVAAISDTTLAQGHWDEPIAFWGAHYADLLRQARRYGARQIGFDLIPNVDADDYLDRLDVSPAIRPNAAFARTLRSAQGHVVLSNLRAPGQQPANPIPELTSVDDMAANVGFVDLPSNSDEVVRRLALFDQDPQGLFPGFIALLAARVRGVSPADAGALRALARDPISAGQHETFWINYTGTSFPTIEAAHLAEGPLSASEQARLRDAMVLVGFTDRASGDWHRVPEGALIPGVEIEANALSTLLDGCTLARWMRTGEALLTLGLAVMMTLAMIRLPFAWGLGASIGLGTIWCLLACYLFAAHYFLLPVIGPLLALTAPWLVRHSVRSVEESVQRLRLQSVFGRYVSPEIRDYLLRSPQHQQLGGAYAEACVLFLDIRGSVSFAEMREPGEVLEELNHLFDLIVPVLDRHRGLLYRFTGDGLLAVFGVPLSLPNPAQAAVDTAMDIVRAVRRLNVIRSQAGLPPWAVGCGIHSGRLVSGNIGAASRSEFTVIGDTVNLAARLEELNKTFASEVVVSRATYESLSQPPPACGPKTTPIRGRKAEVEVYIITVSQEEDTQCDLMPPHREEKPAS